MHRCQYIEENRCFSNGGTNLHIHTIAQGRPEDNQVEFLQGPHGIVNRPKNLVLNNIRRFTMEHIGAANGLTCGRMPLPALSLWLGLQSYRHRLVDGRRGGGPSSVAPRSRNPPTGRRRDSPISSSLFSHGPPLCSVG